MSDQVNEVKSNVLSFAAAANKKKVANNGPEGVDATGKFVASHSIEVVAHEYLDDDGVQRFYYALPNVLPTKENLYAVSQIFKDLHGLLVKDLTEIIEDQIEKCHAPQTKHNIRLVPDPGSDRD